METDTVEKVTPVCRDIRGGIWVGTISTKPHILSIYGQEVSRPHKQRFRVRILGAIEPHLDANWQKGKCKS